MSSLLQQFTVSSVSSVEDIDIFFNIIKRRETVKYSSALPTTSANISYVSSSEINSADNLSIIDRSTFLPANRDTVSNYTSISAVKTFSIDTDSFLISDVFLSSSNTIEETPLFYKHTLQNFISATDTITKVEILDSNMNNLNINEKYLDSTNGIVYSNLESYWSSARDFLIYFIKYTITRSGTNKTFYELLNNKPLYTLATFEDLNSSVQIINDGRKVYLIDEQTTGFLVTLPAISTYAYKPISSGRIKVLPPSATSPNDTWLAKVTNGKFYTTINSTLYKYQIAEYLSQTFTPEPPIKQSTLEESTILSSNLLKLDFKNIIEDDDLVLYTSIEFFDSSGNAKAAFTNDDTLVGTTANNGLVYEKWSEGTRRGIKSIDDSTGVVEIEGLNMRTTWTTSSSYYYEETNYEVTGINLNPISNSNIIDKKVTLFMIPYDGTSDKTIYYFISDEEGRVVESNYTLFNNEFQLWNGNILYYNALPDFRQTTNPVGDGYIDPANLLYFVEDLSVESVAGNNFNYLILGDLFVNNTIGVSQLDYLDTRKAGGGIIEGLKEEVAETYPEVRWIWDSANWDGFSYPGAAAYLVEVPVEILSGAGGNFTGEEVNNLVLKHTAAGIHPLIRTTGVDNTVTNISTANESITIEWDSHQYKATTTVFNVYYTLIDKDNWLLSNVTPIAFNVSGMTHTITGLTNNATYKVAIVGGIEEDGLFIPYIQQSIGSAVKSAGTIGDVAVSYDTVVVS